MLCKKRRCVRMGARCSFSEVEREIGTLEAKVIKKKKQKGKTYRTTMNL